MDHTLYLTVKVLLELKSSIGPQAKKSSEWSVHLCGTETDNSNP
jgi:hypothetical protein